jgi:hypothetical protein
MPAATLEASSYNRLRPLREYAQARGKSQQTIKRLLPREMISYLGKTPFVDETAADAALFRPHPRTTAGHDLE